MKLIMKIKKVYDRNNISKYEISQSNTAIVNSLRRIIISEIPTISIQYVKLIENSTNFFSEFICHRIGLIPLIYEGDINDIKDKKNCDCESECKLCKLEINVNIKNDTNNLRYFTSEDLQFNNDKLSIVKYKNPIPICSLNPGESIVLECYAFKNIGKEHARWCPVTGVSFIKKYNIRVRDEIGEKYKKNYNFILKGDQVYIKDEFEFIPNDNNGFFKVYDKDNKKSKDINIEVVPSNNYILKIETNGSIRNDDIIKKAIVILDDKITNLKKLLEG